MMNSDREAKKRRRLIREGKRVQQNQPENTELVLKVFRSFVTDDRTFTQSEGPDKTDARTVAQPYEGNELYKVEAWINEEEEYETQVVKCFRSSPIFNRKIVIPLDSSAYQYIYIELLKGGFNRDPGPSDGVVVMGRAKIKLPPWNSSGEFTYKYNLVGLNSDRCVEIKGFVELSMQLHRYVEL